VQKDYSPFTPGQPVAPEFFVGRTEQAQQLVYRLKSALAWRIEVVFVSGERGIGKTSLVQFVRYYGERDLGIAASHVHLGGVVELSEVVRRTMERMLQENSVKAWHQRLFDLMRQHVRQVGLFGVTFEFSPPPNLLMGAVRHFAQTLRQILDTLKGEVNGLMLIWDDINGLANRKEFADWLKSAAEEAASEKIPLCLVLVGLEEVRWELIHHNESLARVLFPIEIPLWSDDECTEFFRKAFLRVGMTTAERALEMMVAYSGGHPALAHEIGDAVFQADTDGWIDEQDTSEGIRRAAEIVGRKYLEPQVLQFVRSERYRKILRVLASDPQNWAFKRANIIQRLNQNERQVFDNFLQRMQRLGVIVPDEESGRGAYRFRNLLHFFYFGLEAQRAKEERRR
jgi:hypothetical protein